MGRIEFKFVLFLFYPTPLYFTKSLQAASWISTPKTKNFNKSSVEYSQKIKKLLHEKRKARKNGKEVDIQLTKPYLIRSQGNLIFCCKYLRDKKMTLPL